MLRKKAEPLGNALHRLCIKIGQLQLQGASGDGTKKGRKKKGTPSDQPVEFGGVHVQLLINGHSVDEATENCNAWVEGALLQLGGRVQEPSVGQPTLSEDTGSAGDLHGGHALVPRVEIEFASFSKYVSVALKTTLG